MVTGGIVVTCIAGLRQRCCQLVENNHSNIELCTLPPQTVTITTHPQMELHITNPSPSESDSLIKAPSNTPTAKMSA